MLNILNPHVLGSKHFQLFKTNQHFELVEDFKPADLMFKMFNCLNPPFTQVEHCEHFTSAGSKCLKCWPWLNCLE